MSGRASSAGIGVTSPTHSEDQASRLRDRLDPQTRARLEQIRRGQ